MAYNRRQTYVSNGPVTKSSSPMEKMKDTLTQRDRTFVGYHSFSCGNDVPIYEVTSIHALNQLIGYAKFINQSYGDVYYRGECKLHEGLLPSLFRRHVSTACAAPLNELINKICSDPKMRTSLKLESLDSTSASYKIEGLLQHYGIKTRFLDLVDNHWIALWMGLYKNQTYNQVLEYNHYVQREIPLVDFANGKSCTEDDLFQYILLIAIPGESDRKNTGIFISDNFAEIDLRQALPSTFLRPHAQHGLVVRKRPHNGASVNEYDIATNVVGILKIRIDRVKDWIGTGELLTQNNLFPAPAYDQGYDILLNRTDLFDDKTFKIARYI